MEHTSTGKALAIPMGQSMIRRTYLAFYTWKVYISSYRKVMSLLLDKQLTQFFYCYYLFNNWGHVLTPYSHRLYFAVFSLIVIIAVVIRGHQHHHL